MFYVATGPWKQFSETYLLNLDISIWSASCFLKEIYPWELMMTPLKSMVWWLVSWHPRCFGGSVCWWAAACECGTRGSAEVAYLCRVAYQKVWSGVILDDWVNLKLCVFFCTWFYHRFQTVVAVFHSSLMLINHHSHRQTAVFFWRPVDLDHQIIAF